MVFASYLEYKLLEPLKEKQRQERCQYRQRILEQGRQEAHAEWRAWYNRLLEAKSRGEPFDELPPG